MFSKYFPRRPPTPPSEIAPFSSAAATPMMTSSALHVTSAKKDTMRRQQELKTPRNVSRPLNTTAEKIEKLKSSFFDREYSNFGEMKTAMNWDFIMTKHPEVTTFRAGFVLIDKSTDESFLFVEHPPSSEAKIKINKWGPPKGVRESVDVSAIDTATRELFEETGIDIMSVGASMVPVPIIFYRPHQTFREMIIFFVALVNYRPPVILQKSEVLCYRWFNSTDEIPSVQLTEPTKHVHSVICDAEFGSGFEITNELSLSNKSNKSTQSAQSASSTQSVQPNVIIDVSFDALSSASFDASFDTSLDVSLDASFDSLFDLFSGTEPAANPYINSIPPPFTTSVKTPSTLKVGIGSSRLEEFWNRVRMNYPDSSQSSLNMSQSSLNVSRGVLGYDESSDRLGTCRPSSSNSCNGVSTPPNRSTDNLPSCRR